VSTLQLVQRLEWNMGNYRAKRLRNSELLEIKNTFFLRFQFFKSLPIACVCFVGEIVQLDSKIKNTQSKD